MKLEKVGAALGFVAFMLRVVWQVLKNEALYQLERLRDWMRAR